MGHTLRAWSSVYLLCLYEFKPSTNEEYASFPPHFHLDNYQRCLSQKNGLYCLGTFELAPLKKPHKIFVLMKEYSKNPFTFNRTLIRRGYCVSSRCPSLKQNTTLEHNATQRFEQCAEKWGQSRALRPILRRLHYCRTYDDVKKVKKTPTYEQTLYLKIIYTLLVLNIAGTVYDLLVGDKAKNSLLVAWSVRVNWRRLTATNDGDPRLNDLLPVQGARVLGMLAIINAHSCIIHYFYYTSSPEYVEKLSFNNYGVILANGSILVHMYVMISTFLTAYNFLLYAQMKPLGLYMLPMCIIKRIIRMLPVTLLAIGFAATWWPHAARDGPLISYSIGVESEICREKFWYYVFFLSNIVDKSKACLIPTWFLAADMHIFILACTLVLIMWKNHEKAIRVYTVLMFGTCVVNAVITYMNDWKSVVHITTPENIRVLFRNQESFTNYYISSWGTLPSCFAGLLMAHLHYILQERKVDLGNNKLFVFWHWVCLLIGIAWIIEVGKRSRLYSSLLVSSAVICMDQVLFVVVMGSFLFGLFNIKGSLSRLFAWSGWHAMGRMSLAVMLIHWMVNVSIAARPVAFHTSLLDTTIDWIATVVISYIIAVPVTIMVEAPMQKFLGSLISF
ncbi:hypothetical protein K1T71_011424 [Dendrolimus kikuchii]|uniref:Uncharacterized protein n=1 Tax=Dendrolimus kikuchii TaxID=765133 RepID=A0ACC1CNZ0_9NEOP|nr:hypothetical protein K1T71_011424 [Dendrolimus kikuchii]